jgi:hemerythrin-like domain-containing protein
MSSPIRFNTPAAGFDDPLGLWLACHQRVQRFTGMLPRLAAHLLTHGADAEARDAAHAIRRYFNEAAPHHHEDEEVDLFPRLATAGPDVASAIERLEAEHRALAPLWRELDAALARIEGGDAVGLDESQVEAFGAAYAAHIALEEGVLLPAMRGAFRDADWRRIGAAMAERRGVAGASPA